MILYIPINAIFQFDCGFFSFNLFFFSRLNTYNITLASYSSLLWRKTFNEHFCMMFCNRLSISFQKMTLVELFHWSIVLIINEKRGFFLYLEFNVLCSCSYACKLFHEELENKPCQCRVSHFTKINHFEYKVESRAILPYI